jgi:hypothetical protein
MNEQNTIPWSKDYFLKWSDFLAESNPAIFEDSFSFIKYRFTWTVTSENFGKDIKFAINNIKLYPEFHRPLSWVRIPMATNNLLNHEQGHFDLAELLRLEITEKISTIFENKWYQTRGQNDEQRKQFAREDSGIMIASELDKWEQFIHERHQEYDTQTDFGVDEDKQSEYDITFRQLHI